MGIISYLNSVNKICPPSQARHFWGCSSESVASVALDPTSIISSSLIKVRDELRANVTDPRAGTRPTDSEFCSTAFPSHDIYYPHIIVRQVGGSGTPESVNAPITFLYDALYIIDVHSLNVKELDELCGAVIAEMLNQVAVFRDFGMHAMKMPLLFRDNPVTVPGVHRKTANYAFYMHIAQA